MIRVVRVATLVAIGMGTTYFLLAGCGPYMTRIAIPNRGVASPKVKPVYHEREIHTPSEDEWADWIKAAPKGEEREVTTLTGGTFILKSTVHRGYTVAPPLMDKPYVGVLIGEIESDVYGVPR
ncbi:MAG: hypothetical protein DHS20C16_06680 [Phycisphaerae bacterium]|nr:MAG: hypothetical protein DHS20C16_06680 [Phycisphaerae bacterium]